MERLRSLVRPVVTLLGMLTFYGLAAYLVVSKQDDSAWAAVVATASTVIGFWFSDRHSKDSDAH